MCQALVVARDLVELAEAMAPLAEVLMQQLAEAAAQALLDMVVVLQPLLADLVDLLLHCLCIPLRFLHRTVRA
jgi:hypothetical protein